MSDEDFFNNLSREGSKASSSQPGSGLHSPAGGAAPESLPSDKLTDMSPDQHDPVFDAVIARDFEKAVTLCMNSNRAADGLLLASLGEFELWQTTQQRYMKSHPNRFMREVAFAISQNGILDYVQSSVCVLTVLFWFCFF